MATILVVEDDPSLRVVIRLVLEQNGYQVDEAADGRAAVARMAAAAPDLVLADLRMQRMGGLELIQLIRRSPELRFIPTVLLTGDSDAKQAATTADAVLVKPFEPDELVAVIRRLTEESA